MTKARDLASGAPAPSGVSTTEIGYVDGVTSAIQTQLNQKPEFAAGKNKIINGDFTFNQRNFTSTTTHLVYGFDRWRSGFAGDGTSTYSAQTFTPGTAPVAGYEAINFARLESTGQTLTGVQTSLNTLIEDVRTFAGQTVTLSFWAKANSGTPSVSVEAVQSFGSGGSTTVAGSVAAGTVKKQAITASWNRYSAVLTIPSISGKTIGTSSNLRVQLHTSAGSDFNTRTDSLGIQTTTIDFWGVQLEAGSTATPFQTASGTPNLEVVASGAAAQDGILFSTYPSTVVSGSGTNSWAGYQVAGKNKIINGDFGVWQRGTTFTSPNSGSYCVDRFTEIHNGTGTVTVTRETFAPGTAPVAGYEGTYFLRNTLTSVGTSTNIGISQPIEDVRTFAGQTVTLSFWAKADSARTSIVFFSQFFGTGGSSLVNTSTSSITYSTSWQRFSFTIDIPSISGKTIGTGSTYLQMVIRSTATSGSVLDIWGVQVEAGSVATPFQTATGSVQGELAACQRYYYRLTLSVANHPFAYGGSFSATGNRSALYFPVEMRIRPTALETTGTANQYAVTQDGIGSTTCDAVPTFSNANVRLAQINATVASGLTTNRNSVLASDPTNGVGAFLGWSAEL